MSARKHSIAALCLATLFLVAPVGAHHLPIGAYTTQQGLPRNSVACMVPGTTGVLWLCTSEGLVRFDGYEFRVFGPESGLPSRVVANLVPSKQGGYWIATDRGVCRLEAGAKIGAKCRPIEHKSHEGTFGPILESTTGTVWAATARSLYRISSDGRTMEDTGLQIPSSETINTVADGVDGALWVGTDLALYHWRPGEPARNLTSSLGFVGIEDIQRVGDQFLIATNGGLYRTPLSGSLLEKVKLPVEAQMLQLLHRGDGSIWAASDAGLWRFELSSKGAVIPVEHLTEDEGLPTDRLTGIAADAQGNLWLSTDALGIFRIADSGFVRYSEPDGLGNSRIASLFEDRLGRLCVMTGFHNLPVLRVRNGQRFDAAPIPWPFHVIYFGWGWNQLTFQAHDGEWWFPTGHGVVRFPKVDRAEDLQRVSARNVYSTKNGLACDDIFRLFEDSLGNVWIGCASGDLRLNRWERRSNSFRHWNETDGWPRQTTAMVMRESTAGTLWMGTLDSVARFRNNRFELFRIAPEFPEPYVRDLMLDDAGRVWVATARAGLFRCDNPDDAAPVFRAYTIREGLSSNSIRSLAEDADGFVYAGTVRGVDRIDPRAPLDAHRVRHLTAADGLPDSENSVALRDHRGHLWFGSLRGLAEFNPAKAGNGVTRKVRLTRVRIRGQEVPLPWEGAPSMSLEVAAARNQVEIEYTSVDLRSTASLRYQYRLSGVDTHWSEPSAQRTVNFASLPSGQLRFQVRAVDPEGQSSAPAELTLFVQAPLWRRWWFVLSAIALAAAIVTALYKHRVRELLAIERLRTHIATDLHDDIGASLTQISILSEVAQRGAAPHLLSDIADMSRGMVQDMSDIVWAVNPRHDHFDALVHRMRRFASDTLESADIDVQFETEGISHDYVAPLEARRPLYLVFKEAVNNVVKHSEASNAIIRLALDGAELKLEVIDDGRGFDASQRYAGEGLSSIARRMGSLGGHASWDTIPEGGTRFIAVLPLATRRLLRTTLHRLRR